jgi:hypothetical protein
VLPFWFMCLLFKVEEKSVWKYHICWLWFQDSPCKKGALFPVPTFALRIHRDSPGVPVHLFLWLGGGPTRRFICSGGHLCPLPESWVPSLLGSRMPATALVDSSLAVFLPHTLLGTWPFSSSSDLCSKLTNIYMQYWGLN